MRRVYDGSSWRQGFGFCCLREFLGMRKKRRREAWEGGEERRCCLSSFGHPFWGGGEGF